MNNLIKKAFTLIELLVVIAIIGILSGLIIVTMNGVTSKANIAKSQIFSNSLKNALMMNLVSEWKLDGNANDSWSRVNNGTWYGSAGGTNTSANYRPASECVSGQCLSFDGTDDYVDCGTNTSLNFGNGTTDSPFTLSGWFKLSDITLKGLMGKYVGGGSHQYLLYTGSDDRLYFSLYDASSGVIGRITTLTSYKNKWIYVVATYDGSASMSGIKIYLNGTRVDNANNTSGTYTAMEVTDSNFRIGMYAAGTYMSGLVDDIRVYNAAMPTSQIKEQYYSGLNSLFINGGITREEYLSRINNYAKN